MVKLSNQSQKDSFQAYQHAFTQHIRNPKGEPRPANVPAKRMAIYTEIVYNNIEGILAACYPVTKLLLSNRKWSQLVRHFMIYHQSSTPIFREIPQQFLQHLAHQQTPALKLPAFLSSLMHYEWVELALSVLETPATIDAPNNLLDEQIQLNPALFLLQYQYPVHQISAHYQPKQASKTPTYLIVYRTQDYQIQFIELNAVTFQLLHILQIKPISGNAALQKLASLNPEIAMEAVLQFGAQTLQALTEKELIWGVKKA